MQIFVKMPPGHSITVTCSTMDSVYTVKAIIQDKLPYGEGEKEGRGCREAGESGDLYVSIQDKEGVRRRHQRLTFAGNELENDRTLAHYNIHNESTLHLHIQGVGGMPVKKIHQGEE